MAHGTRLQYASGHTVSTDQIQSFDFMQTTHKLPSILNGNGMCSNATDVTAPYRMIDDLCSVVNVNGCKRLPLSPRFFRLAFGERSKAAILRVANSQATMEE
jgi:hypothetical protein